MLVSPRKYAFPMQQGAVPGMMLRDYFAAYALSGIVADPNVTLEGNAVQAMARLSYRLADAMIAARAEANEGTEE